MSRGLIYLFCLLTLKAAFAASTPGPANEDRLLEQLRAFASCNSDSSLTDPGELSTKLDLPPRQIDLLVPLSKAGAPELVAFWARMGAARAFGDLFADPADFWSADESLRSIYRRVMRRHHFLRTLNKSSAKLRRTLGFLR